MISNIIGILTLLSWNPEKVRYKVIAVEMIGVESSMKIEALGATHRKGSASMVEEWIHAPK